MINSTLGEIAQWVGGDVRDGDPDQPARVATSTDSRDVVPGGLFAAIVGERVDGHDFARAAFEAGAAGVLVSRPVGAPAVLVDDPTAALGRLARAVLTRIDDCTVVGLTGSQGKTTTKDLLAHVLSRYGPTVGPVGSHNTEIGVPLTVLRADPATRYLVVEMGARARGDIAYLCDLTRPRVGVVLNVGMAHVGEFGSREGIAQAKGELVEALPATGLAVLNADDDLVNAMADRTHARVVRFGVDVAADVRLDDLRLDLEGRPRFTLSYAEERAPVRLQLLGRHQAFNAAAAAAAALGLGMELADVAAGLSEATAAARWRLDPFERPDGGLVLNDSYNANPDSTRAALDTLASIVRDRPGSRAVAVLGSMRELGDASEAAHLRVGELAVERGIDQLVVVGDEASGIHRGAVAAGFDAATLVADVDAAVWWLERHLTGDDVVLIKASRADGLERVARALSASGGDTADKSNAVRGEAEGSTSAR